MCISEPVQTKTKESCLEGEVSSLGMTERGAWQQNNRSKYSITLKRRSLTMERTIKLMTLTVVSLVAITFFTGCDSEMANEPTLQQVQSETLDASRGTGELLAWEKARTDYSYLEDKVEEANQFLTENKLNLDDLKQLHDIGNLVFGEYRSKLARNWETRTADFIDNLMDRELFHEEYVRRDMYCLIDLDYSSIEEADHAPNIRILTDHIGERGDYLFVTVRVYAPTSMIGIGDILFYN